jgi:hypothetical protein
MQALDPPPDRLCGIAKCLIRPTERGSDLAADEAIDRGYARLTGQ